jgi:hypothetical protein
MKRTAEEELSEEHPELEEEDLEDLDFLDD